MTGTAGPLSLPQIEAQALAVLERAGDARIIAIQARTQAAWPEAITLAGRPFRLRWCQSPLMVRAALSALEEETAEPAGAGLILLTPLAARELAATSSPGWHARRFSSPMPGGWCSNSSRRARSMRASAAAAGWHNSSSSG